MSDRREQIALKLGLCNCGDEYKSRGLTAPDCPYHAFAISEAMDEYMKEVCLHLLEYMATLGVECYIDDDHECGFYTRNSKNPDHLTKEQLFENFL